MTINTHSYLGASLIALTALTACGESPEQLAAARSYSCTQLAREIGKLEQRKETAQIDGTINSIASVVINDKEERRAAGLESAVNSIDEADADKSLQQYKDIFFAKGCR